MFVSRPGVDIRRFQLLSQNLFLNAVFVLVALVLIVSASWTAQAATVYVQATTDLQAVINAAQPGDTIVLEAGATFTGSFVLPEKFGDGWITVTSSAASSLPEGVRVKPADAAKMPRIVTPGRGQSALSTAAGAHHFRFVGIEFAPENPGAFVYSLISLGNGEERTQAETAHHLEFDRCYIHAFDGQNLKRGVALNSSYTKITNSHLSNFKAVGQDSQAIGGWNGSGNYLIENNYIEAAGENIMFGGSDSSIPDLVPSDIVIRRNHFNKPVSWKNENWQIKNLLEFKNAQRVTVSGNLFENCWAAAQGGTAIVITPRNQDGRAPWSAVRDIEFSHNIVRDVTNGIGILGRDYIHPSQPSERIRITGNLFYRLGAEGAAGGRGEWVGFMGTGGKDITIKHNTALTPESGMGMRADDASGFVNVTFEDNIFRAHLLHSGEVGTGAMERLAGRAWQVRKNVIAQVANRAADYPANNSLGGDFGQVGFVDSAGGNYRLAANSPYKSAGTDGKDVGCDFDALEAAMRDEVSPVIPVLPPLVTLQHVTAAHTNAAALAAGTGGLSYAQFDSLIDEIVQANLTTQSEAGLLGGKVNEVEVRLTVALYFARAAQSLARVGASDSSVRIRLQIAVEHLNQVREALLPANLNVTLSNVEVGVKSVPSISLADARSSATLAPIVAPASAATVMLDRAMTTRGAARVASSSRASVYELAGISVTVGGRAATLVDVSQSRVGFVVPREAALGEAEVVVTTQSGTIARGSVTIAGIAPGIFVKSIGGVGLPLGKAGFTRGGFFRTTTTDASINVATKLVITATGFSFAAPNTNLANDMRTAAGMTPNLAESVAVEARARDGRTWWLNVEFAGVSQAGTGMDQVTVILPPELRHVGTLELTLVIGAMRSNSAQLNFRLPVVQSELMTVAIKGGRR